MSDMREKLIELLNVPIHPHLDADPAEVVADYLITNGFRLETKQATETSEEKTSEWIPVSERLPEHGEVVLCYTTFNDARALQWDNKSQWWLGYGSGDDWSKAKVTHWMPLPEPPKGE